MTFDVSVGTIIAGAAVAGLVGVTNTLFNTVVMQREMRADYDAHKKQDEERHTTIESRIGRVEDRLAS